MKTTSFFILILLVPMLLVPAIGQLDNDLEFEEEVTLSEIKTLLETIRDDHRDSNFRHGHGDLEGYAEHRNQLKALDIDPNTAYFAFIGLILIMLVFSILLIFYTRK